MKQRLTKKIVIDSRISLLTASLMFSGIVMAGESKIDCEVEFGKILNQGDPFDVTGKIQQLEKQLSESCAGTGTYEGGLAKLYSLSGNNEKALRILNAAITNKLPHEKELKLGYFDVLFRQEKLAAAGDYANKLIKEFPDWYGGYISLGQVKLVNEEYVEATKYLTKSIELQEVPSAYILLVIAYFNLSDYRQSALSMQKAVRLDIDSLSHTQAVCAASYSLVELGHKVEAKDLLVKHLKVNPDAANSAEYKKTVSLIDSL